MSQPEISSYELEINIVLTRVVKEGTYNHQTGERMGFNSRYVVPASGFADIAAILGRFEELATSMKPADAGEQW